MINQCKNAATNNLNSEKYLKAISVFNFLIEPLLESIILGLYTKGHNLQKCNLQIHVQNPTENVWMYQL